MIDVYCVYNTRNENFLGSKWMMGAERIYWDDDPEMELLYTRLINVDELLDAQWGKKPENRTNIRIAKYLKAYGYWKDVVLVPVKVHKRKAVCDFDFINAIKN